METFILAYKLNVFSVFQLCQLCTPHMEATGGGAVLNISSMAAENKNRNMASYSSSKAAAIHLTRNIAFDPWQTIAVVSRLSIDIFTNR